MFERGANTHLRTHGAAQAWRKRGGCSTRGAAAGVNRQVSHSWVVRAGAQYFRKRQGVAVCPSNRSCRCCAGQLLVQSLCCALQAAVQGRTVLEQHAQQLPGCTRQLPWKCSAPLLLPQQSDSVEAAAAAAAGHGGLARKALAVVCVSPSRRQHSGAAARWRSSARALWLDTQQLQPQQQQQQHWAMAQQCSGSLNPVF